jgi:hypothetical protein
MTLKTSIHITLTALVAAATAVPAFATPEPKNQAPFVRPAGAVHSTAVRVVSGVSAIAPAGEAKNQFPFNARYSADPGYIHALREAVLMPLRSA